ncbi:MAG: thioredoxin family protein [Nitrospirota bacterium]
MIKENIHQIIRDSLTNIVQPVRLVVMTGEKGCEMCPQTVEIARAIKAAAPKVALEFYDITMDRDKSEEYGITRVPSCVVESHDGRTVMFSGSLEGISLILLLDVIDSIAVGRAWFPDRISNTLKLLVNEVPVQVLLENDCSLCRPVAETAIGLALANKLVSTEIIVADDYPEFLAKHRIKLLPYTLFGPKLHLDGHITESTFLEMIFKAEGEKGTSDRRCIVCGHASPDLICQNCKTKIQAEAVDHKRKDEKVQERGSAMGSHNHG